MQVTVTGRNIEVTRALKDYVIDKLQRAQKHFDHEIHCKAMLSVAKNPSIAKSQTAEVTVQLNGQTIRGAESTENMYASIDFVADKIERQLRKYKTRYSSKSQQKVKDRHLRVVTEEELENETVAEGEEIDFAIEVVGPKIVRSNQIKLETMMPDEACKHIDLLEHEFFMFINAETGKVSTLYHRRDGNFGLIEPQY